MANNSNKYLSIDPLDDLSIEKILKTDSNNCIQNLENFSVEYKEKIEWDIEKEKVKYLKELVALSNTEGGYLIFGIEDKSYKIVGLNDTKKIDDAKFKDAFNKYFSPDFEIKSRIFNDNGHDLFIIYAFPYEEIPCVCIKEYTSGNDTIIKNGIIYRRYGSKSEPIKGNELIELLWKLKFNNTASKDLLEHRKKIRKNDKMPAFIGVGEGQIGASNSFECELKNIKARAILEEIIGYKDCDANFYLNSNKKGTIIENKGKLIIRGPYKNESPRQRELKFRIYFTDEEEYLYYQEFEGNTGKVSDKYIKPADTTIEEMERFRNLNN